MDKAFQHSPNGEQYGPSSRPCQLYMAERCAKNWDGFCEYSYVYNGASGEWPNNQSRPNTMQPPAWAALQPNTSAGDQLLANAAERRFCEYPSCVKRCEPFDPLNPNSARITWFENPVGGSCVPVCRVDPGSVDSDPIMRRLVQRPGVAPGLLLNICNTAEREGVSLAGTDLGNLCSRIK